MANISIQTTRTAMPRCYCYTTPTISDHDGWVKIGYTEQDDVAMLLFLPTAGRISVTAISTPISKSRALSA